MLFRSEECLILGTESVFCEVGDFDSGELLETPVEFSLRLESSQDLGHNKQRRLRVPGVGWGKGTLGDVHRLMFLICGLSNMTNGMDVPFSMTAPS